MVDVACVFFFDFELSERAICENQKGPWQAFKQGETDEAGDCLGNVLGLQAALTRRRKGMGAMNGKRIDVVVAVAVLGLFAMVSEK